MSPHGGHSHSTEALITSGLPESAARLMRAATYASVSVALVLIAAKFWAWAVTDSVSLLSTLIDSLLDALASLVNLIAVRHALQPADEQHRFGYGKAESLAGLAQAAFISGSGLFLVLEASERLIYPRAIENSQIGLMVMGISIVATLGLVVFQKFVISRTSSVAIAADSLHYQMDFLVNFGVALSIILTARFNFTLADPIFAAAIAAYILWGAWKIGGVSMSHLMDKELPEEDRIRVQEIALAHSGVLGLHDLRTRASGVNRFIQLHLEMDGGITLYEAHDLAEKVMYKIEEAFPNTEVLIHQDPQGIKERVVAFE